MRLQHLHTTPFHRKVIIKRQLLAQNIGLRTFVDGTKVSGERFCNSPGTIYWSTDATGILTPTVVMPGGDFFEFERSMIGLIWARTSSKDDMLSGSIKFEINSLPDLHVFGGATEFPLQKLSIISQDSRERNSQGYEYFTKSVDREPPCLMGIRFGNTIECGDYDPAMGSLTTLMVKRIPNLTLLEPVANLKIYPIWADELAHIEEASVRSKPVHSPFTALL